MQEESQDEAIDQSQYLTVFVHDEEYAIGIMQVVEVIQYETLTRVPETPLWIRGVINLRGNSVSVVDLGVKFSFPESEITKRTCIVIAEIELEGEKTVMGVMADSVSKVIDLQPKDIEPPPSFGTNAQVDFLLGMGKVDDRFIMIIDLDRILSTEEVFVASSIQDGMAGEESVGDCQSAA